MIRTYVEKRAENDERRRAWPTHTCRDFADVDTVLHDADDRPVAARDTSKGRDVAELAEFTRSLIEIGLVTEVEIQRFAADSAEGVLGLSRALVRAGRVTAYQAAAIYQKKARGLLLGNYLILEKLGQGGMGVVFKAVNRTSGRIGALKILPPSFSRDESAVSRFRREIEAAGRLNHPNVVAAIDSAQDRGVHFLVMDYVEGRDLDRVIMAQGPMVVSQAVECVIQAARGLEAAHERGIVHRDIKPGNLIMDSGGMVRVLDLGLARIVDAANPFNKSVAGRLTQSGMYMGTIDYMAPEQAEDAHRVDHRADIYSLGCTLFFLLTGREPFQAPTILKRLTAHLEQDPPSLRDFRPEVSMALEACFQKMMAKQPRDRPQSMTEVIALLQASKLPADDVVRRAEPAPKSRPELKTFNETPLKRAMPPKTKAEPSIFARREEREGLAINHELRLEDLVIDVRSDPPPGSFKPKPPLERPPLPPPMAPVRSHSVMTPAAIVAWSAAVVLGVAFLGFVATRRSPDNAVANADSATNADADAENASPTAESATSESLSPTPVSTRAKPISELIFDGISAAGWMLCNRTPVSLSHVQPDGLNPHGTGSYLVVYDQKLSDFVLDFDYRLTENCNSGVFLRVGDLNDPVKTGIEVALDALRHDDDRDSGGFYGLVAPKAYTQKPVPQWNHMTIRVEGSVISVSLNDTAVSLIDLDQWTIPGKRPDGRGHGHSSVVVAKLPRSGYVGFQDLGGDCWFKNIALTNLATKAGTGPTIAKAASPAVTSPRPSVEPYVETARFVGHRHAFVDVVRSLPDGKTLLTGGHDNTVRLWDIETCREIRVLKHPAAVRCAVVLPDGRRAVTGCADGYVRLWDLRTGRLDQQLFKHPFGAVLAVAVSADGRFALSGGEGASVHLINAEKGGEIRQFAGQKSWVWSLAFARDGRSILSGGDDGIVRIGNVNTSDPLVPFEAHSSFVFGLAVAPDGRHAVSSCIGEMILWDIATKRPDRQVKLDRGHVASLAFREDGKLVFATRLKNADGTSGDGGVLGLWDTRSVAPPEILNRGGPHLFVDVVPGDDRIVTGDLDGLVRIWQPSQALTQARAMASTGKTAAAIAEISKAVNAHPNDVPLLIERGRLLAESGRSAEAQADFVRAANLAPENSQLFLNDGWWIAGPYSPGLNLGMAIESDPAVDPSKPPPPSGDARLAWRRVPTEMLGHVDLRKAFNADNVGAYALANVYAQSSRSVVLLVGTDDTARIWFNGQSVLQTSRYTGADAHHVAVTLKPGRNTILLKVDNAAGEYGFHVRISEEPSDFVHAYFTSKDWIKGADAYKQILKEEPSAADATTHHFGAEALAWLERWNEATTGFKSSLELDPKNTRVRRHLITCSVATADMMTYRRLCRETIENLAKNASPAQRNDDLRTATLKPGALVDYTHALTLAKKPMDSKTVSADDFLTYGALSYRARQYQSAVNLLTRAIEARKGKGDAFDWVFLAMARHQIKAPNAKESLKKAVELSKDAFKGDWESKAEIQVLLEEARVELGLPSQP